MTVHPQPHPLRVERLRVEYYTPRRAMTFFYESHALALKVSLYVMKFGTVRKMDLLPAGPFSAFEIQRAIAEKRYIEGDMPPCNKSSTNTTKAAATESS